MFVLLVHVCVSTFPRSRQLLLVFVFLLFLDLFVCLYHIVVAHGTVGVSVAGPRVCVHFPTVASAGLNVISSVVGHRQQLIIG